MARDVNVLMVAAPGNDETKHLINAEVLKALGPEGIVVNVGRGWVIDEQALIGALQRKEIYGAGLDVTEFEPKVPQELLDMDSVVIMPHMTGASINAWRNMCHMLIGDLVAWFTGKGELHPVPECVGFARR
jgi:lactate dehydrogenase-like 2-hydroxyacid dehydrogenase